MIKKLIPNKRGLLYPKKLATRFKVTTSILKALKNGHGLLSTI
jgi:hypothetical protein